jgi:4-hydroxythreonine-4-phosphate dehydrogenase
MKRIVTKSTPRSASKELPRDEPLEPAHDAPPRIRLGITVGDPAGIGPEVALKALLGRGRGSGEELRGKADMLLIGPKWVFTDVARRYGLRVRFDSVMVETGKGRAVVLQKPLPEPPGKASPSRGILTFAVSEPRGCGVEFPIPYGEENAMCGAIALRAIEHGTRLARKGVIDALVTAPISKASVHAAGSPFPGHTELLQSLTASRRVGMLLSGGGLRVALVTIHEALANVPGLLSVPRILELTELTDQFLRRWDCPHPRLALCALNPHCGEGGLFGDEERRILEPAVHAALEKGLRLKGPLPADTVFHRARRGEFDAVIALYHDQALIPIKTLDFDGGVNITMGLPILRTSPDHGTAFAIAGRGLARPTSMRKAIECACSLAAMRGEIAT